MPVEEIVRSVWSPGEEVFYSASGEGRPPERGTFILRRPGVARYRLLLVTLTAAALAVGPLSATVGTGWAPPILLAPILLLGGLRLRLPAMGLLTTASVISVIITLTAAVQPAQLIALIVVAGLALRLSHMRGGVGIYGLRGDQALIELKQRLQRMCQMPTLPRGWGRKAVIRRASGSLFGGDFLVSCQEGDNLQVALVDVSGKGGDAASRAMMLAGTFGGLLGATPASDFLPACNAYLMREDGREGLVTAVHLDLNLSTGRYVITCAGHPPPAKFGRGSGAWELSTAQGIALGVVSDARWDSVQGTLRKGDALMLFTDGMWGSRADVDAGIDRLLGQAGILVQQGYDKAAALIRELSHGDDDSAMVLIWRT